MKGIMKLLGKMIIVTLIGIILVLGNAVFGNPVSKMLVKQSSKEYIKDMYPNTDYYVDTVKYSFKSSRYYAHIKSESSEDTYFSVVYNSFGKVQYDNYEKYVSDGFNTWNRINEEYRNKVDDEIKKLPFKIEHIYGEIQTLDKGNNSLNYGLDMNNLELDKEYNIKDIGSKYGKITLYAYSEEVSYYEVSKILRETKKQLDSNDISFYTIDFKLRSSKNEDIKDWQDKEAIVLEDFLYCDINEESLENKIENHIKNKEECYKYLDKKERKKA